MVLVGRQALVKVLFVCTGNICRSPTAEGVMRAHVAQRGLSETILVDSAGTHGAHEGEPPDQRSRRTALAHGIEIGDQRARQIRGSDFDEFDLILALDLGHLDHLKRLCPPARRDRLALLMSFAGEEIGVPDPYYGIHGFEDVFAMVERGVIGLLDHLEARR
jgi:protein-tyrosine phosphatase